MLRRGADGELEGAPCAPHCYSGKQVLSPEAFQKKMDAELRRVEGMSWPWTAKKAEGVLAFCLVENSKVAGVHRACEKSTSGPK